MAKVLERLKAGLQSGAVEPALLEEVVVEWGDLVTRANDLEELLIMIVRTGWPWDEEGEPNAIYHASRDGYAAAMVAASELLGLGQRSSITRTEPRT
jgi:hypothetical protein